MGLKLVSAPASEPLTLEEAKAHVREDSADFDEMIEAFISTAVQYVDGPEGFLGRALIDQTWDYYLDRFPHCRPIEIEIPLPPTIEVQGVFYLSTSGTEQEFPSSSYKVDDSGRVARIVLKGSACWPSTSCEAASVRIRFRAGYLNSDSPPIENVPRPIKTAILMYVGDLYLNRETQIVGDSAAKLPWAAEQLLRPYRVYKSMA